MSISSAAPPTTRQRARHRLVAVDAVGDDEARSTSARGFSSSPSITGTVDGITRRCATHRPGAARIAAASSALARSAGVTPRRRDPGVAAAAAPGYAGLITISPR